ncbi:GH23727p, putative [Brugia malayi]|uniref:Phosphate transporter n=2 Tax=Brugia malayi TaxID=6279 RepID=A0A4E9FR02_BRUMA|nr:GH23727p, putative [Brugia malayi]VIO99187.1 GH23727p, putative [Brugia malayi]
MDFIASTTTSILPASNLGSQFLWALILGIVLAFVLGFAMGANDVANAFGTSVGSKVLSLRKAYILAIIFESLGALFIGYNVTDTMRKSVINLNLYKNAPEELLVGQVAILAGCSTWLLIATFAQLPVSTTHSITGATVGFGLIMKGTEGIHWWKILNIVASWIISPLLSGIVSSVLYIIVDFTVIRRKNPFECGLRVLPYFYWFCIAFNTFAISFQGSKILHLAKLPLWLCLLISAAIATVVAFAIHFLMVPKLRKWIEKKEGGRTDQSPSIDLPNITGQVPIKIKHGIVQIFIPHNNGLCSDEVNSKAVIGKKRSVSALKHFVQWFLPDKKHQPDSRTTLVFGSIQAFTACFEGFAHGANDVANAIAPLAALLSIYAEMDVQQNDETPIWVLAYGVLAICVGLVLLGHKVIRTVGSEMSNINPASGFTIEFGAAVTALLASKAGLPISTTHCLVGSVVAVGVVKSRSAGVRWSIFRNIFLSWVVTLPASGIVAGGSMLLMKFLL